MAGWDRRGSCGSWDVFFKIIFGQNFGIAVLQNLVEFRNDTNDLLAIKLGTNPDDQTRNTIHGQTSKQEGDL